MDHWSIEDKKSQSVNEETLKLALCAFNTFELMLFLNQASLAEILLI